MIRIHQVKMPPGHKPEELEGKIKKLLKLSDKEKFGWNIAKCSIDARKKPEIYLNYTVDVTGLKEQNVLKRCKDKNISLTEPMAYRFPALGKKELAHRPVIVGTGPAGLFCGYMLAKHGYRPILLERGKKVEERYQSVEAFWKSGVLDTECNVQFGEGGAGTFSDGKLNTLVKDKDGRNREVLSIFVEAGAPEAILYEGKPHIGTDILMRVVKNMRETIIRYGGEVHFDTKMTGLIIDGERIKGVVVDGKNVIPTETVVLAIGHSARDTFEMLYQEQIPMEAKSFAVGLRTEHPQKLINASQYGMESPQHLPPASYKLTAQTKEGRGVYSFCMCPGGYVVNASSEVGRLAVNGMSYSKRDGANANSAIIVSVTPKDYGTDHPLGGLAFQRKLEEKAYAIGNGNVPVEYYRDFKYAVKRVEENAEAENTADKIQKDEIGGAPNMARDVYPPQIKGKWQFAPVHEIMPAALNRAFVEGMESFERTIPGFAADEVLLSGIESRTSSPVRIHRDETGQSTVRGLYPCGEGAGYAGGITSAAMDGIRIAEYIAKEYKAIQENESWK